MTMVDLSEPARSDTEHDEILSEIEAVFRQRPGDVHVMRTVLRIAQKARSGSKLEAVLRRSEYFIEARTGNRYISWLPNLCNVVILADRSYIVAFLIDTTDDRFVFDSSCAAVKKTAKHQDIRPRGLR